MEFHDYNFKVFRYQISERLQSNCRMSEQHNPSGGVNNMQIHKGTYETFHTHIVKQIQS